MNRHPALNLLLSLALLSWGGASAGTPAGTIINNVAQGQFLSPVTGQPEVATSNAVQTVVQSVCAPSVTPDGTLAQPGQTAQVLPGEGATFPYTLVNAGNDTFSFPLGAVVESGSAASPALSVVLDSDGNGRQDAGEPVVQSVTLGMNAQAKLLLIVGAVNVSGNVYVNLKAGCAGGTADENNVSLVQVGEAPVLSLSKTFTPALVQPGRESTVTVTALNSGAGASREVVVTDLLADQVAQGLTFVAGSAAASAGTLEYTTDTQKWSGTEPAPVRGVRVRVPSLAPGASVKLTFRLLAGASLDGKAVQNVAVLSSGAQSASAAATLSVRYQPGVALGPLGNPEAEEGSAADRQERAFAVTGQPACFDHTAKNTGDVADRFTLSVTYPQGGAQASVQTPDGQLLAQPLSLGAGESAAVRVCYDAQPGRLEALVTVRGERGTSNATRDAVAVVEGGLPTLVKSYVATTVDAAGNRVDVAAGQPVRVKDTVVYTLAVTNPYSRPLTGVVVTDAIPAHLDALAASDGGVVTGAAGAQQVRWTLGTLEPQETRRVTLTTRVSERVVDGEALKNTFTLTSTEVPGPLTSNETSTPVWNADLRIAKSVSATTATYGDRLVYTLTITNTSATTEIVGLRITDEPPAGLMYLPGSASIDGQPADDPTPLDGGKLLWTAPSLGPKGVLTVKYTMRVTPQAAGELVNYARVTGTGAGVSATAIASLRAQASVRMALLGFAPQGDIVGTVYVDRDRDGRFTPDLDTPLPRARVLLAGGRETVTDAQGRYHFANVPLGMHALRLDPASAPYTPAHVPQDGGLPGTRSVNVQGLTGVDFPLTPPAGGIAGTGTTFSIGDVTLTKTLTPLGGGRYAVSLRLSAPAALDGAQLNDPLPVGATLKEGRNTFTGTLPAGQTILTYTFAWDDPGTGGGVTDPSLTWRAAP